MTSKLYTAVIEAHARGYRVLEDGTVRGMRGVRRVTFDDVGFARFNVARRGGGRFNVYVHKLAAYQLFGELAFAEGARVIHLNNARADNRLENIALGTQDDVMQNRPQVQRLLWSLHAARSLRSLDSKQLQMFRDMRAAGASLNELAKCFGIAKSTASYIVNRKTYA